MEEKNSVTENTNPAPASADSINSEAAFVAAAVALAAASAAVAVTTAAASEKASKSAWEISESKPLGSIWRPIARKGLGLFGGMCSLGSGLLWFQSAQSQVDATVATNQQIANALTFLSVHQNYWASYLAAGAGIAIGIALLLED